MRYRIGELADFFDMTKEGVRYLERQGVIHAERDEKNGYRYYPRDEITRLKQIRRYQSLGFSLEEAQQMFGEVSLNEIPERLSLKQKELAEKARQIERMQRQLTLQQEVVAHLLDPAHDSVWLGMRPELIFFPRVPDEASGTTPEEREAIAQARAEEKEWILAAPPCTLGALHYAADGSGRRVFGSIVRADSAREIGLRETARTVHLMPCPCVCGVVEGRDKRPPDLSPLMGYVHAHGLTITGDVYGIFWLNYRSETGDRRAIHEIFVPYAEIPR